MLLDTRKRYNGSVRAECLLRYEKPVSPNVAVKVQNNESTVGHAHQSRGPVLGSYSHFAGAHR